MGRGRFVYRSDDILKLSVAVAALAGGLGMAYHYAIYLPGKDQAEATRRNLIDLEKQNSVSAQKAADDKRVQARNASYRICLSNALGSYSARWNSTCRDNSARTAKLRSDCVVTGSDSTWCAAQYPALPESDCQLSSAISQSYDATLKEDRQQCLDEAKSDVASLSG